MPALPITRFRALARWHGDVVSRAETALNSGDLKLFWTYARLADRLHAKLLLLNPLVARAPKQTPTDGALKSVEQTESKTS